jgi:adenylate kinase
VILLGPPGAGKGTQALRLAERLGLCHMSTGDVFRQTAASGSALGRQVAAYMDRGLLVPDSITVDVMLEQLSRPECRAGALLDGFPRTVAQAEALDQALALRGQRIDAVLDLEVSSDVLLARLGGRWICRTCPASYHEVTNPPQRPGICDRCGGELYQRADDSRDTARTRLQVYAERTAPVLDYYRRRHMLRAVSGENGIDEVTARLIEALRNVLPHGPSAGGPTNARRTGTDA